MLTRPLTFSYAIYIFNPDSGSVVTKRFYACVCIFAILEVLKELYWSVM